MSTWVGIISYCEGDVWSRVGTWVGIILYSEGRNIWSRVSTWVGIISYCEGGCLEQREYLDGDHIIRWGDVCSMVSTWVGIIYSGGNVWSRVRTWVGIISYCEGGCLEQGEYPGGDHIIL